MAAPPALTPLRIDSSDLPCILNKKSNSHDRRVRQVGRYLRPQALEDAVAALADGGYTVLAGGTDVYPARVGRAFDDDILDITALAGQRAIDEGDDGFRIGALTTWSDLLRRPLPPAFAALKQAAREVGGVQIQNAGTLAGNLCNASPAADGVPPPLALDDRKSVV